MVDLQPAQLYLFDRPLQGGPPTSEDVRNNFEALARTFYTDDTTYPEVARQGMMRIFDDSGNVKIQWYDGTAWKTVAQNVGAGIPAPAKQIVEFTAAAAQWVVDHNLGTKVAAQVYDSSWNLLPPAHPTSRDETVFLGHIPPAVLTALTGTQTLRATLPLSIDGSILSVFAQAAEALTGAPDGQIEFEISGIAAPTTGGVIALALASLGDSLAGTAITGNNTFSAGETLLVRSVVTTAPTAGGLDLFAVVRNSSYTLVQPTDNRIIVNHPAAVTGRVVLFG